MTISMISAMDLEGTIGKNNKLPWGRGLPADLTRFKEITMGKPIIMGRKTWESIGRPLPGRKNIVISKTLKEVKGITVVTSPQEAIEEAEKEDTEEMIVIGGESIYREFYEKSDKLYITLIHHVFKGDTRFPLDEYNREHRAWLASECKRINPNEKNKYKCHFITLVRG